MLQSYGIKEDKESTEKERQGVVTEKEVTGRISGKQKPVHPPSTCPEMRHTHNRQERHCNAVRSALSVYGEKRKQLMSYTSTKQTPQYSLISPSSSEYNTKMVFSTAHSCGMNW